ncbi:hypothetical protein ACHWQZ_G012063 [Mnemiopsis leidyi]
MTSSQSEPPYFMSKNLIFGLLCSADREKPQLSMQPSPDVNPSHVLEKHFAEYTTSQQVEILRIKLDFLRKCVPLKRPPPSLRVKGASAIPDQHKLFRFSCLETDLLSSAISYKIKEIDLLTDQIKSKKLPSLPLPWKDRVNLRKHFETKISFYQKQDNTKWETWPPKPARLLDDQKLSKAETRKRRNFKKKWAQKKRKTEKDAERALKSGSVVILVNETVPTGAIALLGKGLGFVPTPKLNIEEARLDMRLVTNKILYHSYRALDRPHYMSPEKYKMPAKHRRPVYTKAQPSSEPAINAIVDNMHGELDYKLKHLADFKTKSNLSRDEVDGLKWLEDNISAGKLAVAQADKGGAILIVYPTLLEKKTLEKLNTTSLYTQLAVDPNQELNQELHDLWCSAKMNGIVSPHDAKTVVGISDNARQENPSLPTNRPSTLSIYKPGKPYFYPSLKIHKLHVDDLKPGCEPPIRLITALQEGVTKRADVFLCDKFLQPLEVDFCKDILKDSTDTLIWLDELDKTLDPSVKKGLRSFSFDFKSLYDSLSPELVITALDFAINQCRPDWSQVLKCWIIDSVKLSLKASVGMFQDKWYRQKNGVPTGGTLCVQLANIAVYYVLSNKVYNNPDLMRNVISSKRYIDDGSGLFRGTKRMFTEWITQVNTEIGTYGLFIDEYSISPPGEYVSFLDINFCIDK